MNSPPKRKAPGQLGSRTGRKLIAYGYYAVLSLLASLSGGLFWAVEQRRWRISDRIENEDLQS
jgi:hypothetical protein